MRLRSRALALPLDLLGSFAAAAILSVTFILIASPVVDTLSWEYDEGTFIVQARFILRGLRPFADFAHHQPPLHLYLLALAGKLFGPTLFGYRMLSVTSVALGGLLLFCLIRPVAGSLPALVAQAAFLFSPSQIHALNAVTEPPMVLFSLLGVALLFLGTGRWSAYASGVAFVIALLIKPTCLLMVLAAVLSLAYAGAWRRLRDLGVSGVVGAIAGLAWMLWVSDGIFADVLRFHVERLGTRNVGMWSFDSGFAELRHILGIDTRGQWALFCLKVFCVYPETYLPSALFALAFLGVPVWTRGCARERPALGAFAVLWPASYLILNLVALDYVSAKYFVPFLAFTAFLLAGVAWWAERHVPRPLAAAAVVVVSLALAGYFAATLGRQRDPWYYGRADWITREYPALVSFTPMIFAATGAEPACEFENPAITYGAFGEAVLDTNERTRRFRFSDERLVSCLRAHPETRIVVDFWYYFFTRPGSPLREYLNGEGSAQRVFFSPQALEQWEHPRLVKDFVFR